MDTDTQNAHGKSFASNGPAGLLILVFYISFLRPLTTERVDPTYHGFSVLPGQCLRFHAFGRGVCLRYPGAATHGRVSMLLVAVTAFWRAVARMLEIHFGRPVLWMGVPS